MVRAKVVCSQKVERNPGEFDLQFIPVYGGTEENKQFFRWTPSLQLSMQTVNPSAADKFEQGKEYYLDFSPA